MCKIYSDIGWTISTNQVTHTMEPEETILASGFLGADPAYVGFEVKVTQGSEIAL